MHKGCPKKQPFKHWFHLRRLESLLPLLVIAITASLQAQELAVSPTPPMGWNSWDSYGLAIDESQFRANATVLKTQLRKFGWQYAVIDEGWFLENPQDDLKTAAMHYAVDAYGRFVPTPLRFPSAGQQGPRSTGAFPVTVEDTNFTALANWLHGQGLKFGIHIIHGIPRVSTEHNFPIEGSTFQAQDAADRSDTCSWDPTSYGVKDNEAGQAWYDSLLRQYASWGVDFLKVDCIAEVPYEASEIRQIRRAIDKSGRPIILSLSPRLVGFTHAQEVSSQANLWRISNDVWDVWDRHGQNENTSGVKEQFERVAAWEAYARPNHWPDADMLPIGELKPSPGNGSARASRLTPEEQRTQISLWAIARSPLILGSNLTLLGTDTLRLITNRDIIRVNQTATHSAQVLKQGDLVGWKADLPGGEKAIALFNLGDTEMKATVKLAELDEQLATRTWKVRDAWSGKETPSRSVLVRELPAHGCVVLLFR